jgi:hypothetical protein
MRLFLLIFETIIVVTSIVCLFKGEEMAAIYLLLAAVYSSVNRMEKP